MGVKSLSVAFGLNGPLTDNLFPRTSATIFVKVFVCPIADEAMKGGRAFLLDDDLVCRAACAIGATKE